MIKAILLDLDDTLLQNPDAAFVPAYLHLADSYFEKLWGVPHVARVLRRFAQVSCDPRPPHITNSALALALLVEYTSLSEAQIMDDLTTFYATAFKSLEGCVERVSAAGPLVEHLLRAGYAVVIATNPLYPDDAIRHRLRWAGLPDDFSAYALVTTGDNMHYVKPDPAYYAEIIARVGIEPDEAVMVGDNVENDILPASTLGLNTYHITAGDPDPRADGGGNLAAFFDAVARQSWLEGLLPRPLSPAAIEPELRGNIGALFGFLDSIQPHFWTQHPDPEEWSLLQIICHLLESETTVQLPRLQRILAEDNPFLANPQPPLGPRDAVPCDEHGRKAALRFAERRAETIEWLSTLPSHAWSRPARHSIFGLTTLLEMAHFTAQHDRLHINQLCQTLGRCE